MNEVNGNGETALLMAVDLEHTPSVKTLLKAKADVNVRDQIGQSPLYKAVVLNNYDLADMLLGAQAEPTSKDNNSRTMLHACVQYSDADMWKLLMAYGSRELVNDVDDKGDSVLHYLAKRGTSDDAELLEIALADGADRKLPNREGSSAFDLVEGNPNQEVRKRFGKMLNPQPRWPFG